MIDACALKMFSQKVLYGKRDTPSARSSVEKKEKANRKERMNKRKLAKKHAWPHVASQLEDWRT